MLKWENRYSEEPAMETQLNRFDLVGFKKKTVSFDISTCVTFTSQSMANQELS
jgi:hypothetical protein